MNSSESLTVICRRQVEEMEEDIEKHHKTVNSVQDWLNLCRKANMTEIEMRVQLLVSGQYNLASPLGWAWLTQVYLPAQKPAPCPRSRAWQIEEKKMRRDRGIAMLPDKRVKRDCPFDFQLCHSESCLLDDILPNCPCLVIKK